MADTPNTPDLDTWKANRPDGNLETYWRAGFRAQGQAAIVVEQYCTSENTALTKAEDAAEAHYNSLVDVGAFVKVEAFVQRWQTQARGNADAYDAAKISTRIVLDPPTDITPAEAIMRARGRAARIAGSLAIGSES